MPKHLVRRERREELRDDVTGLDGDTSSRRHPVAETKEDRDYKQKIYNSRLN